jgi:malate dehydrogenase
MKVTIVGAGNVGASCADAISYRSIASEVVLLDIKEGFAEGKAMDIMQCATNTGFNTQLSGVTNDYSKTANSDVVVITSGIDWDKCWNCKIGFGEFVAIFSKRRFCDCF